MASNVVPHPDPRLESYLHRKDPGPRLESWLRTQEHRLLLLLLGTLEARASVEDNPYHCIPLNSALLRMILEKHSGRQQGKIHQAALVKIAVLVGL